MKLSKYIKEFACIAAVFLLLSSCRAQLSKSVKIAPADAQEALADWEDHKYSMFIHWGLYSIPAGVWNGKEIKGYSEQIKGHAKIETEQYRNLASQFNPVHWNADEVAILAKKAGMKSIILTSKHHDGFCLFDSKFTKFDVIDATPYKKDIVKELSEACARHNLKFGIYFSLIDWDYEGALPFESVNNSDLIPDQHHQYNLNQVEELLTNYGDISEIWFDMGAPTYEQSKEIATLVKSLQPNCMISGRIWNDQGDFVVMGDNLQPDFKMGVPWQTPASMFNETWSYRSWQERPAVEVKVADKIHDLLNIVSAGGNYLLNIGPKGDGSVIAYEKQVLQGVGEWLDKNGEAIYGTNKTPLQDQEWGVITTRPGKVYLHIIDYPQDHKLIIKGLNARVHKAYPLADPAISLESRSNNTDYEIDLTNDIIQDKNATTIVLEYEGDLLMTPLNLVKSNDNNQFILTTKNAEKYHSYSGHDYYSTKATVIKMKWNFENPSLKESEVKITVFSSDSNLLKLAINNEDYPMAALSADINQQGYLYELKIPSKKLNQGKINVIELSLADQSNPHKGMAIEGLEIRIE